MTLLYLHLFLELEEDTDQSNTDDGAPTAAELLFASIERGEMNIHQGDINTEEKGMFFSFLTNFILPKQPIP